MGVVARIAGVSLLAAVPPADSTLDLREIDRVRIAEAYRLADTLGDSLWKGWSDVPFVVLLVTPEREFLVGHPAPTEDFTLLGRDELLAAEVWSRERVFEPNLLATFPAVGAVSTVVIGQAENTHLRTSTPWVLTLLHEHFHQLQNTRPGYFEGVETLDLAKGDTSGGWMLDYAFPYEDPEVVELYDARSRALLRALKTRGTDDFVGAVADYFGARSALGEHLAPDDAKYLEFQVWQEGVARYTEQTVGALAGADYEPSAAFRALEDFTPYERATRAMLERMDSNLADGRLATLQRGAFYSLGAGEGTLLDEIAPDWRGAYFERMFSLDAHFE
jgi:hypothetical protein